MRTSAFVTAAFAATALSAPFAAKRDLEIDTVYDVVYVTNFVTETVAAAVSTVASATPSSTSISLVKYGHRHSRSSKTNNATPTTAAASIPVVDSTSAVYVPPTTTEPPATSTAAAASTSAALSSSAAETSSAAKAVATSYQQLVVAHHNVHRSNHSAPAIAWDAGLANTALSIAKTCEYKHNTTAGGGGYGQNIAAGVPAANIGVVISDLFYNGEVNYYSGLYGQAQPDMSNFGHWGHFSQIVWKDTTKIGCATYDCSATGLANTGSNVPPHFTVCNYGTPGNYANEYGDNVGSSLNRATVVGSQTLYI